MKLDVKGSWPALVTPFTEDDEVDYEILRRLVDFHMENKSDGILLLGSTSEDVCEYYERGLEGPGVEYDAPPPYLRAICDPLDEEGYVSLPQQPGMGYDIIWEYIDENRVDEAGRPAPAKGAAGQPRV